MYFTSISVERLFHVYDGFVFPHANWWNKINSYLSDTGIGTKESHAYALMVFLKTVNLNISGFDVKRAFENVCRVYYHMKHKKYLLYNAPSRQTTSNCTDQLDRGIYQVICVKSFIHAELEITVGHRPFSDHFQGFGQANPIC